MVTTGTPLQIRAVPSDVIETLKRRAAAENRSLSAYVLRILEIEARSPTLAEVLLDPERPRADITTEEIVELIREGRESR
jgi:plasmid stability protein